MRETWPEIVFAGDRSRQALSAAARRGSIVRLAAGIYSGRPSSDPAVLARRNWAQILGHELPGAVITDRSARSGVPGPDGRITVVHSRQRPLELPGLRVEPRPGPGPLPGDTPLMHGLLLASPARAMLESIGRRSDRYLTDEEIEQWIAEIIVRQGLDGINALRDQAHTVAPLLGRTTAFDRLDLMIGAALGTRPSGSLLTPVLRAQAAGAPIDQRRIDAFATLIEALAATAPRTLPDLVQDAPRRALLPFYEAYFSNYIEGTIFSLDEAAGIVFDRTIPVGRPADAHDIIGTYQVVSDPADLRQTPTDGDELVDLLQRRHATIMALRPDRGPGRFKWRANQVGTTLFVAPELVEGTLRAGFDLARGLRSPFARAVYLMFLVAEVHPFEDGNGRMARVMMNAELSAAGEVRIVIPTVYRANYLAALRGATHNGFFEALIEMLAFAQRWTGRVDFSDRATAESDLARTNALVDATDAEDRGLRLTLP